MGVAASIVMPLGVYDDVRSLGPGLKLGNPGRHGGVQMREPPPGRDAIGPWVVERRREACRGG